MNIHVIRRNTLNIPRGLYTEWMGNALSDSNANTLISEGTAILTNIGNPIPPSRVKLESNRASNKDDSGAEPIYNASSTNYTLTLAASTIIKPTVCQQESTGTITVVAGSGVTFIGSSLATDKAGSLLSILPTNTLNTYIIVKGGL